MHPGRTVCAVPLNLALLIVLNSTIAAILLQFVQEVNADTKSTATHESQEKRNANILSFDGGGSRGIMEVAILDDVMRLVTILKQDPTSLEYLTEDGKLLLDRNKSQALVVNITNVTDPIHPAKVFDMIVGTSTGGLIAFGLVGGNTDNNGKRMPMSLRECIEMYLKKTEKIFEKTYLHRLVSDFSSIFTEVPLIAYSQENLKKVLSDQFGESILGDFRDSESVAAAVARKIGQKEDLVLFDTKSDVHKFYETKQVLLATADAPVYFETPVKIGHHQYVDGGVGGNCPLVQAIPRAQEIFGDVSFVLSVAPPSPKESEIPSSFQLKYWLKYFVQQSTDGYAVYKDAKRRHKFVSIRRLMPRGESLKDFDLDENDAKKMFDAIKKELANSLFLVDVIATATFVLNAYTSKGGYITESSAEVGAKLARLAGKVYADELEHRKAEDSYNTSLSLWRKITDENVKKSIAETEGDFSECLIHQGKYREASKHAKISLQNFLAFYGNKDHERISYALFMYGKSLHLIGDYKEGYKKYKLALEMQKRIYGGNASNHYTAKILTHMAWLCREQGELEKTEGLLTNALRIWKHLFGEGNHIDVARTLDSLGLCFMDQRKFKTSEKYLQESLEVKKSLLGNKNHPAIAASYNNLGLCLVRQRRYKDGQNYLRQALVMKQALHPEDDHKSIAITLNNLATSLVYQGQYNVALEYAQQALAIEKRLLANIEIPAIAKTLHTIGLCFVKTSKFLEAHKYIKKAIKITEDMRESRDHPLLAKYLNTLGDSLLGIGNYTDAKVHFNRALRIIDQQRGGKDDPDVPDLLRKLADVCKRLSHKEDEVYYRKRLEETRQVAVKVPHFYSQGGMQSLVGEEKFPQTKPMVAEYDSFELNENDLTEPSEPSLQTHTEF